MSVPGGLDAGRCWADDQIRHPVRLDDPIRFLRFARRDKKPLENLLDALQAKAGSSGFAAANGWRRRKPGSCDRRAVIQRSGPGFVTPDAVQIAGDAPSPLTATNAAVCNPGCSPIFIHRAFLTRNGDRAWKWPCNRPWQHRGGKICGTGRPDHPGTQTPPEGWPSTSPGTRRGAASAAQLIGSTSCLMWTFRVEGRAENRGTAGDAGEKVEDGLWRAQPAYRAGKTRWCRAPDQAEPRNPLNPPNAGRAAELESAEGWIRTFCYIS